MANSRIDLSRFLQMRLNVYLAYLLPRRIYQTYLYLLGVYYYLIRPKEFKDISDSIRDAIHTIYDKTEINTIILKTYFGIVDHYYEKLVNAHKPALKTINYLVSNISIINKDWLDDLKSQNKGCLLVTGHFGAVEYLPAFLAGSGYQPSMIVRFKTNKLREVLIKKSKIVGIELIDADAPNVAQNALKAIGNGRILITLFDEFKHWRPCKNKSIDVFGECIPQDRTLDVLCKRTNAPACLALMYRQRKKYVLKIDPICWESENISMIECSWKMLEKQIFRNPDQWYQWQDFRKVIAMYLRTEKIDAY
jgi:KDO2-lipid IV(A) lauroyltransferase